MPKLVNLTGRTVTVYDAYGERAVGALPPSGAALRADVTAPALSGRAVELGGHRVPTVDLLYELDEELPPSEPGTVYVVSWPVIEAVAAMAPERLGEFVAPDTSRGGAVRDARDRLLGVRRFRGLPTGG